MLPIVADQQGFINLVKKFQKLTGYQKFIPCEHEGKKKPPVKVAGKRLNPTVDHYSIEALEALERSVNWLCIGLYLGDRWIALDMDGNKAITYKNELEKDLGELPRTFYNGSNPGNREAMIFEIPEKYKEKINKLTITLEDQELDFRTGKHYQIIAGIHPSGKEYQKLNDIIKPAVLPESWCEYLVKQSNITQESTSNGNGNGKHNVNRNDLDSDTKAERDLQLAIDILGYLKLLNHPIADGESYQQWIYIGMILHSIDDSVDGLAAWIEWSSQFSSYDPDPSDRSNRPEMKWKTFRPTKGVTIASLIRAFNISYQGVKKDKTSEEDVKEYGKKIHDCIGNSWKIDGLWTLQDRELFIGWQAGEDQNETALLYNCHVYLKDALKYYKDTDLIELLEDVKSYSDYNELLPARKKSTFPTTEVIRLFGNAEIITDMLTYCNATQLDFSKMFMFWLLAINTLKPKKYRFRRPKGISKDNLMLMIVGEPTSGKSWYYKLLIEWFIKKTTESNNEQINAMRAYNKIRSIAEREIEKYWKEKEAKTEEAKKQALIEFITSSTGEFSEPDPTLYEKKLYELHELACEIQGAKDEKYPVYSVVQFTDEAIRKVSSENTDRGLLVCPDEIMNLKRYQKKQGSGDSLNWLMEFLNGDTTAKNTAGEKHRSDYYQGVIISSIQPGVLTSNFDIKSDEDGTIARCLWVYNEGDVKLGGIVPVNIEENYKTALANVYEKYCSMYSVDVKDEIFFEYTEEAAKLYQETLDRYNDLGDEYDNINKAYKYWIRRSGDRLAVISFFLHLACNLDKQTNSREVNLKCVECAVKILDWFNESSRVLYNVPEPIAENLSEAKTLAWNAFMKILNRRKGTYVYNRVDRWQKKTENPVIFEAYNIKTATLGKSGFITLCEDMERAGLITFDRESMTITKK